MMLPFEPSEFRDRIAKTKQRMEHAGIDVLVVANQSNQYYLTGYAGWSDYVPQAAIISLEENDPRFIVRDQDVPCAYHSCFMDRSLIYTLPESYVGYADRSGWDYIAGLLNEWGHGKRRLGIELQTPQITAHVFRLLQRALPNASFVDATNLVTWLRTIKSPREIAYMREAARIADKAVQTAIDAIAPGVRECDVAAKVMAAQCAGLPEFGGDRPKSPAMPSGKKTDSPHLSWTDAPYATGTPINIELGGFRYRYVAGLSRSIHVGPPPARLKDLHAATLDGMLAVFDAVKPGLTCEEVEKVFRAATKTHDVEKNSRVGYSIGIDWLEGTASIVPGDKTVLQANMTFHLMLGMWQRDWGYTLSETFRVTEKGCETLASLPRELFVK